jgi:hypothetical protein
LWFGIFFGILFLENLIRVLLKNIITMKRLIFIMLCVAIGTSASAQSKFGYGPKIALNLSSVNLDDIKAVSVDNKMRVGMAFGGFASFQVNHWLGL